jgi:serine/threonine protein kinase
VANVTPGPVSPASLMKFSGTPLVSAASASNTRSDFKSAIHCAIGNCYSHKLRNLWSTTKSSIERLVQSLSLTSPTGNYSKVDSLPFESNDGCEVEFAAAQSELSSRVGSRTTRSEWDVCDQITTSNSKPELGNPLASLLRRFPSSPPMRPAQIVPPKSPCAPTVTSPFASSRSSAANPLINAASTAFDYSCLMLEEVISQLQSAQYLASAEFEKKSISWMRRLLTLKRELDFIKDNSYQIKLLCRTTWLQLERDFTLLGQRQVQDLFIAIKRYKRVLNMHENEIFELELFYHEKGQLFLSNSPKEPQDDSTVFSLSSFATCRSCRQPVSASQRLTSALPADGAFASFGLDRTLNSARSKRELDERKFLVESLQYKQMSRAGKALAEMRADIVNQREFFEALNQRYAALNEFACYLDEMVNSSNTHFEKDQKDKKDPQDDALTNPSSDSSLQKIGVLGKGTFGSVYEVMWKGLPYAFKTFNAGFNPKKEIDIWKSLRYPNIIRYFGERILDYEKGVLMEKCDMSLAKLLGTEIEHNLVNQTSGDANTSLIIPPRPSGDVPNFLQRLSIAHQIVGGLSYLHEQQIMHRDIKSDNILVNERRTSVGRVFEVRICDFGSATSHFQRSLNTNRKGSLHYMSPEMMRTGSCDPSGDVYSFGILLWELVFVQMPYLNLPASCGNANAICSWVADDGNRPQIAIPPDSYFMPQQRRGKRNSKHAGESAPSTATDQSRNRPRSRSPSTLVSAPVAGSLIWPWNLAISQLHFVKHLGSWRRRRADASISKALNDKELERYYAEERSSILFGPGSIPSKLLSIVTSPSLAAAATEGGDGGTAFDDGLPLDEGNSCGPRTFFASSNSASAKDVIAFWKSLPGKVDISALDLRILTHFGPPLLVMELHRLIAKCWSIHKNFRPTFSELEPWIGALIADYKSTGGQLRLYHLPQQLQVPFVDELISSYASAPVEGSPDQ